MLISDLAAPIVILSVLLYGIYKKVDLFEVFVQGAYENLKIAVNILPALLLLMTAVGMLSASGALEAFSQLISPLLDKIGFPSQVAPLALMRPVSGSGSLAVLDNILSVYGADSFSGRVASVLMGSTETTFYTIAVYYSAVRLKAEFPVFISSLTADFAGFVFSALIVRLFY